MQNRKLAKPVFGLLAGEASGDNLGAALISALKKSHPEAQFIGVGGLNMKAVGMQSSTDIDELSVNGIIDPLMRLPSLLRILFKTRDEIVAANPLCFIGIDFNFFNLLLAGMLKKRGIKTVHYVSPTVWAWRKGRIKTIAKKIDLMLTLYPFEVEIYHQNNIDAVFVGHPKADEIDPTEGLVNKPKARDYYKVLDDERVVAVLPGSRGSEVAFSAPDFFSALEILCTKKQNLRFLIPAANQKRLDQLEVIKKEYDLPIEIHLGDARRIMTAADVVLVNSGTATLEAMLLKKPMVMSYRLGWFTYAIVSRLLQTDFFALPNILSQKPLVEELIQADATPEALSKIVLKLLDATEHSALFSEYETIHQSLRKNAATVAAEAISDLVRKSS